MSILKCVPNNFKLKLNSTIYIILNTQNNTWYTQYKFHVFVYMRHSNTVKIHEPVIQSKNQIIEYSKFFFSNFNLRFVFQ